MKDHSLADHFCLWLGARAARFFKKQLACHRVCGSHYFAGPKFITPGRPDLSEISDLDGVPYPVETKANGGARAVMVPAGRAAHLR
jgi:hypothetical protein